MDVSILKMYKQSINFTDTYNRTHYILGKCLWKMFNCDDSLRTTTRQVEIRDVLDAFRGAIAALPQRRDSRADPIFEPHFKLLSIVHRLVLGGKLTVSFFFSASF